MQCSASFGLAENTREKGFPHVFSANPILPHDMRRRYKPDMRDASSHGQTSAKKQQGSIFTEDKGQRIGA